MTFTVISELEVRVISREVLVRAALFLQIDHAWLMENNELKEGLQEKNQAVAALVNQFIDSLWSCHFVIKTKNRNLTESDKDLYLALVNKKNDLRNQVAALLSNNKPDSGIYLTS